METVIVQEAEVERKKEKKRAFTKGMGLKKKIRTCWKLSTTNFTYDLVPTNYLTNFHDVPKDFGLIF